MFQYGHQRSRLKSRSNLKESNMEAAEVGSLIEGFRKMVPDSVQSIADVSVQHPILIASQTLVAAEQSLKIAQERLVAAEKELEEARNLLVCQSELYGDQKAKLAELLK